MPSFGTPALLGHLEEDGCDELAGGSYEILDGKSLMIGRDRKTCDVVLTDPTVSNQHLQIYTTIYTEDNRQRVFTYAKDLSTNGSYWRYKYGNHWNELLIGPGKAVLLSDGDRVRLCDGSSFVFQSVPRISQCPEEASVTLDEETQLFKNLFRIMDRKLGSGGYGEVWMAVDILHNRQMACKVVTLNKSTQGWSRQANFSGTFWREVDLLKDISHPNILRVERVFFTDEKLYIISDLITGGDLMSYIERPGIKISDAEACIIVYQILKALEYLHRQGICHRDLKPENILMSTPAPGARVILADFGHSIKLQARSRRMKTFSVGTDYYVAPEVRGKKQNSRGYTMAADMWSLGIISALILTGESVFENSKNRTASPAAALDAAAECDLAKMVHSPLWQSVSHLAKDFVRNLLVLDEKARFNVEQALEHGWFTGDKRREDIQQQYTDAIRGWIPSRPLLDFKEDLAIWRQASQPTLDTVLMPPPASRPPHRPEIGQRSSPFFSLAMQDDARNIASQAAKKRGLESDDEADKPSILPKQAIPSDKRVLNDSRANLNVRREAQKPARNPAMQAIGGEHEHLSHTESSQKIQQASIDLDYEERRLYDRVSREEASTFKSAKCFRQSVEKRMRLGD